MGENIRPTPTLKQIHADHFFNVDLKPSLFNSFTSRRLHGRFANLNHSTGCTPPVRPVILLDKENFALVIKDK